MRTNYLSKDRVLNYIVKYEKSRTYSVKEAYTHPSSAKLQAESNILNEMYSRLDAIDYRILSYNCQYFTAAYRILPDILIIHTPCRVYKINIVTKSQIKE